MGEVKTASALVPPSSSLSLPSSSPRPSLPSSLPSSPPYLSSIESYGESLSVPTTPFVSSFTASVVYSLTPHELSLLFQSYNGDTTGEPGDSQGVGLTEFSALVKDFLDSLRRGLEEKGLGVLSARVTEWVSGGEGGVEGWVGRLFSEMDRRGSGRVGREDFTAFLPLVDQKIGEQLRREWKKTVVLPQLMRIALL